MRRLLVALLLLALASPAWGWDQVSPTQHGTLSNSTASGTASNVASITLTGVAFRTWHIYHVSGWCNSTWASMSIKNGTSYLFKSSTSFVTTNTTVLSYPTGLTGSVGSSMFATVGPCAPGSIATITVQADNY